MPEHDASPCTTRAGARSRRAARGALGVLTAAALAGAGLTASGSAATAAPIAASTTTVTPDVTITPDPSQQGDAFQGWGTSLAWFAEATGGYPDAIKEKLADLVFGKDGLDLNIARFNIGGGNAPDVPAYLRPGGAVPGWWKAPAGTTRADTDWWDPDDSDDWNWDADPNQSWWIDAIKKIDATKDETTHWEAFSNSPPWFMTTSGYVSGGFSATTDQLKTTSIDDFTTYLTDVVDHLEQTHGISFDSIEPFNEPNTNYWGTTLGSDGNPTGGRQEGAHMSPALMAKVVTSLQARLEDPSTTTTAKIAAMDETNPSTFVTDWFGYTAAAQDDVSRLNVHAYSQGSETAVRDIAKATDKPLWMSEVEGTWGSGQSFTDMAPGLGMANQIVGDLSNLQPDAWTLWQPVEDYDNMKPGGESAAGANWGEIQMPFDCTSADTLTSCPIYTNTKFDTIRNFTHYITPGDHLVPTNDTSTVAAVGPDGSGASVVHVNGSTSAQTVALDLSKFASTAGAKVVPVVTDASGALVKGAAVRVNDGEALVTVPAQSVTTFVVTGASGVAADAPTFQDGHVYRLQGVQSGRSLAATAEGTSAVISTDDSTSTNQLWKVAKLTDGNTDKERYQLTSVSSGGSLAVDSAGDLVVGTGVTGTAAQWMVSTTGNGTYTLVNADQTVLVEVGSQKTADGSAVDVYQPNAGQNQLWKPVDETVLSTQAASLYTTPGLVPVLPTTVVTVYPGGARGTLPVTWESLPDSTWDSAGAVTVHGTATTAYGTSVEATAKVTVDTVVSSEPARAKAYVGSTPDLPTTITAVTKSGATVDLPVTWDSAPDAAYDQVGVVTLSGEVATLDGAAVPATARVQVTEPVLANVATQAGTTVAASYTENGYPATNVVNGSTTDKGWSTWKSGTQDASETLTFGMPTTPDVGAVKVYFYKDGTNVSWSDSVQVQEQGSDGTWTAVSADTPVVFDGTNAPVLQVPVTSGSPTKALRVLFTNPAGGRYLTVSEVQLLAKSPGESSEATLGSLTVDGATVPGFSSGKTSYTAYAAADSNPTVAAVSSDPYADLQITPATGKARTAVVTVTSEDGTQRTEYTVRLTDVPTIKSVSVADGDTVSGKVKFKVALAGPAKDVSYTYVELNKGSGHVWVTDNTKAAGSSNSGLHPDLVVDTRDLANGAYGLKVDAVGTNGKTTEKTVSFTVNNPPALKITNPDASATVSGKVTVKVKLSGQGLKAYNLRVDSAGLSYVYEPTAGTFTFKLDTTTLSDGVHTLLATATDTAGNKTTVTEKITVDNAS